MRMWTLPCAGRAREGLRRAAHDMRTSHIERLQVHDKHTITTQHKKKCSVIKTSFGISSHVQSDALKLSIET